MSNFGKFTVTALLTVLMVLSFSSNVFAATELFYDDGEEDGYTCAVDYLPRYVAVRFFLPLGWGNARLLAVKLFKTAQEISGSPATFMVHVLEGDGSTELMTPFEFTVQPPGGEWKNIPISGYVTVPDTFYIAIVGAPEVCIGTDGDDPDSQSFEGTPGSWTLQEWDRMIRAVVDPIGRPVGGALHSADKLALLSPWLIAVGLIGCAAVTPLVIKKLRA